MLVKLPEPVRLAKDNSGAKQRFPNPAGDQVGSEPGSRPNILARTFFASWSLSAGNCPRRRWRRCRSTEPSPDKLTTQGLASQGGFGNEISLSPPRVSVVNGATSETVRWLSGLAHKTRQGFAAAFCLRHHPLVIALRDANWIGHCLHVVNLSTRGWLRKRFSCSTRFSAWQ